MKRFIAFTSSFAVVHTHAVWAAQDPNPQLPSWVEKYCKVSAFERQAEWLLDENTFYQTKRSEVEPIQEGERPGLQVSLTFDDSKGCQGRVVWSACFPIGLDTPHPALIIFSAMTNCRDEVVRTKRTEILLK